MNFFFNFTSFFEYACIVVSIVFGVCGWGGVEVLLILRQIPRLTWWLFELQCTCIWDFKGNGDVYIVDVTSCELHCQLGYYICIDVVLKCYTESVSW